ncbi:MAG: hypothetical protein WB771_02165 [Solirubrobacterales bacterium]
MNRDRQDRTDSIRFGAALGSLASASAAPYGYTVSVWSSGAVLIHFRGSPNVGDVFLFVVGALAGFSIFAIAARRHLEALDLSELGRERVVTGVLNWFAVGIAVGAVALIAQIPSRLSWSLAIFTATVLYLLGASIQLMLVARQRGA